MQVNQQRLWDRHMQIATIGAIDEIGSSRLALSQEDYAARALFASWCANIGMGITYDAIGNLYATQIGTDETLAPVLMGSHLDTQPRGGRFDGIYGVLSALEVLETLHENNQALLRTVKIVVWTNEEGARFSPAMLGSAVFNGSLDLEQALAIEDENHISIAQALAPLPMPTESLPPTVWPYAYLEAHIEQGPVLENNNQQIGIVTGGQGIVWLDVTLSGLSAHAGTFPMTMRHDALLAATHMILQLENMVNQCEHALLTIGQIRHEKGSYNTIIGQLYFSIDLRHPDQQILNDLTQKAQAILEAEALKRQIAILCQTQWENPAQVFSQPCVDLVEASALQRQYRAQKIISGAGHDAIELAKVCPTAMVFIPCLNGISHNIKEYASPEDVANGANVLLDVAYTLANDVHSRFI